MKENKVTERTKNKYNFRQSVIKKKKEKKNKIDEQFIFACSKLLAFHKAYLSYGWAEK